MFHVSLQMASSTDVDTGKMLLALVKAYFDEVSTKDGGSGNTEVQYVVCSPADNLPKPISIYITTDNKDWVMKYHMHNFINHAVKTIPALKDKVSVWAVLGSHFSG